MEWTSKNKPNSLYAIMLTENYVTKHSGFVYNKGDIFIKVKKNDNYVHYCDERWFIVRSSNRSIRPGGFGMLINDISKLNITKEIKLEDYPELYPHYPKTLIKYLNR